MAHDVELVEQDCGLRRFILRDVAERLPHVHHGELDFAALFGPQPVVERRHAGLGTVRAAEPDRSFANQVADHDAIAVALADRYLVDANRAGARRAGALELGPHVLHLQRFDRVPVELQIPGDIADRCLPATAAKRLVKCGLSARKSNPSRFTVPQRRQATRRTSNSRTIRNPALDRSRTCRARRSYQPVWTRPQQSQTVFLSADRGARSAHSDHRIHHVRSPSLESLRTNIHPTDAAVASQIRPSLSVPKSSGPPSLRKPLSTSLFAAMIPQNHPLDSLKTLFCFRLDLALR